jgi:hypothetical protein
LEEKLKAKQINISLLLLLTLSLILIFSSVSFGQNGGSGFRVTPVRSEFVIEKGESNEQVISVTNLSDQDTTAGVVINDFVPADNETGEPRVLLDNTQSEGNSFKSIATTQESITLGPRETKDIKLQIKVPENATTGGYYGVLRFEGKTDNNDNNIALAASVGTIFLVTVPGDIKEELILTELATASNGSTSRIFINTKDIEIVTRLKNTGNIHVKPYGVIDIKDSKNNVIESFDLNNTEPRANVLPDSTRKFENKLQNKDWFGKYTVSANLGYGSGGSLITAKNTFWVIPIWVVIVAVVALVAIIVGAFLVYRKLSKNNKHKVSPRR